MKRVRFIFWSQSIERPKAKGCDVFFGTKNPKGHDYATRYDYSASVGICHDETSIFGHINNVLLCFSIIRSEIE